MITDKNIAILGCGWLGKQLARSLKEQGACVYGSYRNDTGKAAIEELGVIPFECVLHEEKHTQNTLLEDLFAQVDFLILTIPPFRGAKPESYGNALVSGLKDLNSRANVIFTGSTGIYPQKEGVYTEEYSFQESAGSNELLMAETKLRSLLEDRLTILRMGGLIGPGRHPINSLSGKQVKSDGREGLALVHSDDVIRTINWVLENDRFPETYNVVYPTALSKRDYYTMIAEQRLVAPPVYSETPGINRKISSDKLLKENNSVFQTNILLFGSTF